MAAESGQSTAPEDNATKEGISPWLETGLVFGGLVLCQTADDEINDWLQRRRNDKLESFADIVRPFGGPAVYVPVGAGLYLTGLISGNTEARQAAERICLSLTIAGLSSGSLKYLAGRSRPSSGAPSDRFRPFCRLTSFPSGHTTMAFTLAGSISREIDNRWATAGLHLLAGSVGLSRLIDELHWLSDIVAGALLSRYVTSLVYDHVLPGEDSGVTACWTVAGPTLAWCAGF
ncbi:MAG: phosphatase PAP2 family protein [bacterium]